MDVKAENRQLVAGKAGNLSVDALREMSEQRFADIGILFDQRLHDINRYFEKAFIDSDLRYQQRFDAQGKALEAALLAADKAVIAAFTAAKQLVDVALAAADKAVTKAETASEKRFEGVNEFRKQLADQTSTFIPRVEADVRFAALVDRLAKVESAGSIQEGAGAQRTSTNTQNMWAIALVISVVLGIAEVAVLFFKH